MIKKKVFFPILALAIIGTAAATTTMVSAQDSTSVNSIVTAIAQKFNLNETDVQAVFEEQRTKHHAEMKANMEQKLTQAVTDGKITETQKKAIQEKFATPFIKKFDNDMSEEEMKAFHEQKKAEMDAWLSQNGLTHELLREVMGGHPKGFGGKKVLFMAH